MTHPALGGGLNQDSCWVSHGPKLLGPCMLALVADGMGGVAGGARASRIAIREGARVLSDPSEWGGDPGEVLKHAVEAANYAVSKAGAESEGFAGMGATMTAVCVGDGGFCVAHSGDSLAAACVAGRLRCVTEPHADELGRLTSFVGMGSGLRVDADCCSSSMLDFVVVCSDGLTRALPWGRIEEVVSDHRGDPEGSCEALISETMSCQIKAPVLRDDVTVAVLSRIPRELTSMRQKRQSPSAGFVQRTKGFLAAGARFAQLTACGGGSSLAPAQRALRNALCSPRYDYGAPEELTH